MLNFWAFLILVTSIFITNSAKYVGEYGSSDWSLGLELKVTEKKRTSSTETWHVPYKAVNVKGLYEKAIQKMKTFLKTDNIRSAFKNSLYALTTYQTYEIIRAFSFKLYSLLV